jgi:hypothetical protein
MHWQIRLSAENSMDAYTNISKTSIADRIATTQSAFGLPNARLLERAAFLLQGLLATTLELVNNSISRIPQGT